MSSAREVGWNKNHCMALAAPTQVQGASKLFCYVSPYYAPEMRSEEIQKYSMLVGFGGVAHKSSANQLVITAIII